MKPTSPNFDHNPPIAGSLVGQLTPVGRWAVLAAAFGGLLFAGVGLGLMPIASRSVTLDVLGPNCSEQTAGVWLARYTASLMLGAACGGIWLGQLGDRIGRTRALGVSILVYSLFAGAGSLVENQSQLLALRFLAGLGIGGTWPNGAALVAECFPDASRPLVAGVVGAGINVGILLLSQVARFWHIVPESWRWVFAISALPTAIGFLVIVLIPESPKWLAGRNMQQTKTTPVRTLFKPPLARTMWLGIALGVVPMVGAWAASKWMLPWADKIGKANNLPGYQATAQGFWALGAVVGSFLGAPISSALGRRRSYFLISLVTVAVTCGLFLFTKPLDDKFLPWVFMQGSVATLFFGWLPLYLPEMFPTAVRATGTGLAYNSGRFATAVGVLVAGLLIEAFQGDYAKVGAVTGMFYGLGMVAVLWLPKSKEQLRIAAESN